MHACIHVCVCVLCVYVCVCVYTYTYMYVCVCVCLCVYYMARLQGDVLLGIANFVLPCSNESASDSSVLPLREAPPRARMPSQTMVALQSV